MFLVDSVLVVMGQVRLGGLLFILGILLILARAAVTKEIIYKLVGWPISTKVSGQKR